MTQMRILISEGNEQADRAIFTAYNGCAPSGMFEKLLRRLRPDIESEILLTTDADQTPQRPLTDYDGILFTGSNSNIHKMTEGTHRQLDFARTAFKSGTPMFGICWGLQLATVAAGGEVGPSQAEDCKCEAPFSFGVSLSEEGRGHPMHLGRPEIFDTFGFHSDQVTRLAPGSRVTARNRHFIQGVEITGAKSVFWGVQYHPELDGPDTAGFMRGSILELVDGEVYTSLDAIQAVAEALDRFAPDSSPTEADMALFGPLDLSSFDFRPIELMNWLDLMVLPAQRKRISAEQPVRDHFPQQRSEECFFGSQEEQML
ncbi:type 1 glutamine amidotransferase [Sulfitobacter sp. NFXS29]|uniref:type 1 glutamine amidotransferase n=1 Tax=Sulfitobacter sp. NFXS29 TaxID=2818438 RepID=UPI0032DE56EB